MHTLTGLHVPTNVWDRVHTAIAYSWAWKLTECHAEWGDVTLTRYREDMDDGEVRWFDEITLPFMDEQRVLAARNLLLIELRRDLIVEVEIGEDEPSILRYESPGYTRRLLQQDDGGID